ncbi:MAG: amidohydrolase [Hyphomicrobiales bacterium]|nr:amidohydrolase [Hyphomicrobiales bacterium]MCP5372675.1 amidohydrolase [Hyphomicrobiales bacterium]
MDLTVYTARKIHTMNPSQPDATAVAVADGLIVEVGTLDTMAPWLEAHPHVIDDRFAGQVLMPGFIDPHLHPSMAAILLPMHFITAMEWRLPWRTSAPVHGHNAFLARLSDIEANLKTPDEPLFSWGYHEIWHGPMGREVLDGISETRPIIVWQRSFHEIFVNGAALAWMGLQESDVADHPQVNFAAGRFYETGLSVALARFRPYLLEPERFRAGLERVRQVTHFGGHTTIGDMAVGLFDLEMEWQALTAVLENDDTPFRVHMTPRGVERGLTLDQSRINPDTFGDLAKRNTHRLFFSDHVKLFTDGGYFAQLMQVGAPGFIDGHAGEWLMAPEHFEEAARAYWMAGLKIHVHCTGDLGLELALDVLEKLQWERPRFNHGFTIEHFGLSTPEQCRRIADLGAMVSANVYYLYELGDAYWRHSIGYERASQMSRLGTLVREGVRTALHTDFTMAPALPLNSAWVAANRINDKGDVMAPLERLDLHQALRAITIDAAYMLGLEDQVGSIRAGKKADFTVLEADPYETPVEALKDIPIWGTVFEGRPFPIAG